MSGVQQGDPLGSVLFALAIHPILQQIGRDCCEVLVAAYADNVTLTGRLSKVRQALERYVSEMINIGLTINPLESQIYIPQWKSDLPQPAQDNQVRGEDNGWMVKMADDLCIPLLTSGIKILGCPASQNSGKLRVLYPENTRHCH